MSSPTDVEFSKIIRCPVTKSPLETADPDLIASLNQQILEKKLVNRIGQTIATPLEGGYINESQTLLLPIRGGIVILIEDQAIDLNEAGKEDA
ncbi:MAG: Trm112 family protein [Mariniblastus sp.]